MAPAVHPGTEGAELEAQVINRIEPHASRHDAPSVLDLPHFRLIAVRVGAVDLEAALEAVGRWIAARRAAYVCFRDVHGLMLCRDDPELHAIHERADLVAPDGMPLVWAGRLIGVRRIGRVCGPDFLPALCAQGLELGYRHFFYGGGPGVAERLATRLKERFPGLAVAGIHTPPFRPLTDEEDREVVKRINESGADVVWVGLGTPKQERWMAEHRARLRPTVLLGVGAAFDFHAGAVRRAPVWMQRSGLEWLFRLVSEPRRLWRRYLVLAPRFVGLVVLQLLGLRGG